MTNNEFGIYDVNDLSSVSWLISTLCQHKDTHIHKDHEDSQRKAQSAGTTCVRAQAKNNYLTKYCVERETWHTNYTQQ